MREILKTSHLINKQTLLDQTEIVDRVGTAEIVEDEFEEDGLDDVGSMGKDDNSIQPEIEI